MAAKTTAKKSPAKKTAAKKTSTGKKAPAKKAPAKKAPAKKSPAKKSPTKKASSRKAPAKKISTKMTSMKQVSNEEMAWEEMEFSKRGGSSVTIKEIISNTPVPETVRPEQNQPSAFFDIRGKILRIYRCFEDAVANISARRDVRNPYISMKFQPKPVEIRVSDRLTDLLAGK